MRHLAPRASIVALVIALICVPTAAVAATPALSTERPNVQLTVSATTTEAYEAGMSLASATPSTRGPVEDLKACKKAWNKSAFKLYFMKGSLIKYAFLLGCMMAKGWSGDSFDPSK